MLLRRFVIKPRRLDTTRCGELGPLPIEKLLNFENRAAVSPVPLPVAALEFGSLDATVKTLKKFSWKIPFSTIFFSNFSILFY